MFDHAINSYPYYACYTQPDFASPRGSTNVVLALFDSSFPLTQCTRLEVSEPFGIVARSNVVDACFEVKDILDEVHDLTKTPLEGSCYA